MIIAIIAKVEMVERRDIRIDEWVSIRIIGFEKIAVYRLAVDCRRTVLASMADAADAATLGAPRGRDAGDAAGDGDGGC